MCVFWAHPARATSLSSRSPVSSFSLRSLVRSFSLLLRQPPSCFEALPSPTVLFHFLLQLAFLVCCVVFYPLSLERDYATCLFLSILRNFSFFLLPSPSFSVSLLNLLNMGVFNCGKT